MHEINPAREWGEPLEFGNGLRLRWSRSEDIEAIGQLASKAFREHEEAPLQENL